MEDGSNQCSHFIALALLSDTRIASKYHQSLLMSLNLKRKIVPQCVAWRQLLASVQLLCAGSGNEEAMEWKGCGLFNQCKHCFKEKDLVTEQQVTRGEITAQSINKHTITVVAVLESSCLRSRMFLGQTSPGDRQGALNKLKGNWYCLAWSFISLGFRDENLFYPGWQRPCDTFL